jgi:predicted GIY-YIG superfamily endonuclease
MNEELIQRTQAEPYQVYKDDTLGEVYIIHLHSKFAHAQHYVGFSKKVEKRLFHHRKGTGATFLLRALEAGISFTLVVRFAGTKNDERRLKNTNNTKDYCPICAAEKGKQAYIFKAHVLPHERTYTFCEL